MAMYTIRARHGFSEYVLQWMLCCCLIILCNGASRLTTRSDHQTNKGDFENEAIVRLSQVFGIDKLPIHRHHRSPPQYMMDLYQSVAYQDGITKTKSPYGSDVVRSLPDRGNHVYIIFMKLTIHTKVAWQ